MFVLNLFLAQMIPLKRVQKLVKSLIGKAISEATILRYTLSLNNDLEQWEENQVSALLKSPSMAL